MRRRLEQEFGIELITPAAKIGVKPGRKKAAPQKPLTVERLSSWMLWPRRVVIRYEFHAENSLGALRIG